MVTEPRGGCHRAVIDRLGSIGAVLRAPTITLVRAESFPCGWDRRLEGARFFPTLTSLSCQNTQR